MLRFFLWLCFYGIASSIADQLVGEGSLERCTEMTIMIGISAEGDDIIVTFPSVSVNQIAHSVERCAKTGLPLASVLCLKMRGWVVFNTFKIKETKCNGSVYRMSEYTNASTSATKETSIATSSSTNAPVTSSRQQSTTKFNSANKTKNVKLPTSKTDERYAEFENIVLAQKVSGETFHSATKIADSIVTSLMMSSRSNHSTQLYRNQQGTIVKSLETLLDKVELPPSKLLHIETRNFIVDIREVDVFGNDALSSSLSFSSNQSSLSFDFPLHSIQHVADEADESTVKVGFILFKNDVLFPSVSYHTHHVISATIKGMGEHVRLLEPITFKMSKHDLEFDESSHHLACGYWDFRHDDWSETGCHLLSENDDVICQCNHLTNFAILVDPHRHILEHVVQSKNDFLDYISDVGCVLSIICLALTIIIHLSFENLRRRRPHKVLIHLSVSLLLAYTLFLLGIDATENFVGCALVAILLHYFWLCAWCWMAVEGYTMYCLLVRVMESRTIDHYMLKASLLAYGIPTCIVTVSAGYCLFYLDYSNKHSIYTHEIENPHANAEAESIASHVNETRIDPTILHENWRSNYVGSEKCWPWGPPLYFGFLLPVGLIILLNIVVFIKVLRGITSGRTKINRTESRRSKHQQLFNVITLTTLLGISWSFGFVAMISSNPTYVAVMQGIHSILNSTQGVSLFFLFCIRHHRVRVLWTKSLRDRFRSCKSGSLESAAHSPVRVDGRAKYSGDSSRNRRRDRSSGSIMETPSDLMLKHFPEQDGACHLESTTKHRSYQDLPRRASAPTFVSTSRNTSYSTASLNNIKSYDSSV